MKKESNVIMKKEYETPDEEVVLVEMNQSVLQSVTGGDDEPDIPPFPGTN